MASATRVTLPDGQRTWTVVGDDYSVVGPVEDWLDANRELWSPNTVRAYATVLAQWWSFLGQRGERWDAAGVGSFGAFLAWQRTGRRADAVIGTVPPTLSPATLQNRLAAVLSFYRWQEAVHDVPVAARLYKGCPRWRRNVGLLSHLDSRSTAKTTSVVRVRGVRRERPPILLPSQVQAIIDACANYDDGALEWSGNLRDRFLFSLMAESGLRLGEALGMRVSDFVMGRGGSPYVLVVPREANPNGARVKMMRPRRVYVSADLERLYADYVSFLALRADAEGQALNPDGFLFVNLDRPPLFSPMKEATVRSKVAALKKQGIGPPGWTPHWFRHTHASALLLAGAPDWVVSRRLGHAHVQTTLDLYGWVSEDAALQMAANWKNYASNWQVLDGDSG